MQPSKEILENRKKLVAALRSGEFPQGRFSLRSEEGFCCLGVACEVFRRDTGIGKWDDVGSFHTKYRIDHFVAPEKVMFDWLGHDDSDPIIFEEPDREIANEINLVSMIAANDGYRKTFVEIADAYEARYITPFEGIEND